MNRVFEFWTGSQSSGKTYQLRKRAINLADRPSVRRVIVVAPPGEWSDLTDRIDISDLGAALVDWDRPRQPILPRVTIGDSALLEKLFRIATAWGDCAIVLDEAALWVPATLSVESLRQRSPYLFSALVRGRHLERSDGLERPIHLVIAAQYPRSVHMIIADQARVIMVANPDTAGEHTKDWIRGTAGRRFLQRASLLGRHQWTPIRGRDPRRG